MSAKILFGTLCGAGFLQALVLWPLTGQAGVTAVAVTFAWCAAPLLIVATPSRAWVLGGSLLTVLGAYLTYRWDALRPLRRGFSEYLILSMTRDMAAVGLTAVGLALVLGGLAGQTGGRRIGRAATVFAMLCSGVWALGLLGAAVLPSAYSEGEVVGSLILASLLVVLAGVLIPTAVVRRSSPIKPAPGRVVLAVLTLLLVSGVWTYLRTAERFVPVEAFPDRGLAVCVAEALHLDGIDDGFSQLDLDAVNEMECGRNPISSLEGVERLGNLRVIFMPSTRLSDLTPLSRVSSLEEAYVGGSDLSQLNGVTELRAQGVDINGDD
ncbi:hypothetical protein [Kineosporia babensis]|uniref:Leucine-rich repeat domain-containing protein n=1 Tax=Kineosporia babensis TaxID=499548 RepID=A0A9X1NIT9_9ACTN|nr:hypothetical protein [Kineosporia babensis]MCD5314374.1 hypothetical protein [Kineosporia babensis]